MPIREEDLSRIRPLVGQPVVKLLTGMRGCGKSALLSDLRQELRQQGVLPEQIISLDLEALEFTEINTARRLQSYIKYRLANPGRHYVFLDEIQVVPQWEQAIAALAAEDGCDLYLSSSAVRQTAAALQEATGGKCAEFRILPMSWAECQSLGRRTPDGPVSGDPSQTMTPADYLAGGGLPVVVQFQGTAAAGPLLQGACQAILLQDVILRTRVRDVELLNRIFQYVLQYLGKLYTVKSIADTLKKRQRQASAETIANHLRAMEEAGLIWRVPRLDIKSQTILHSTVKYYLGDHGLAAGLIGRKSRNAAGILENAVFIELLRRNYGLTVGKLGRQQIDFLAERDGRRLYVQIAHDPAAAGQLASPLLMIRDQYPKLILSRDEPARDDIQGVRCLSLASFLSDRSL